MCKPGWFHSPGVLACATVVIIAAIERAMAYLDTGELPWDMDLFDGDSKKVSPVRSRTL